MKKQDSCQFIFLAGSYILFKDKFNINKHNTAYQPKNNNPRNNINKLTCVFLKMTAVLRRLAQVHNAFCGRILVKTSSTWMLPMKLKKQPASKQVIILTLLVAKLIFLSITVAIKPIPCEVDCRFELIFPSYFPQ